MILHNKKHSFLTLLLVAVFSISTIIAQNNKNKFVIVLDAGHGGGDTGNLGNGYKEKNIALNIVLKTGKVLEKDPSIKVIYTRKTDVFVTLKGRAKIANDANADLFVSVHCNSHHTGAYGSETFVLGLHVNEENFNVAKKENGVIFLEENYQENYQGFDPNSPESAIGLTLMQEEYLDQSILLASYVQNYFTNKLRLKNRGVKQAGFWVLHNTYMPSVLIEAGFLTSKREGAYLNSTKGQIGVSKAITDAILDYKNHIQQNVEENVVANKESTTNKKNLGKEIKQAPPSSANKNIYYKVQISAGSAKIALTPQNFKGLKNVTLETFENIFRYVYGKAYTYNEAKRILNKAKETGFKTAFVVAYKNNKRIPLYQAIKTEKK